MPPAIEHILSVLLVIALGWGVTRAGLLTPEGRAGIERLTYYVLFPCLIFFSLAKVDFQKFPAVNFALTLLLSILALVLIAITLRKPLQKWLVMDGPAFTSFFQGVTRWNTFIGLAIGGSIYGPDGLAMIAIAMVAVVPLVNVLCVLVLAHWAAMQAPSVKLVLWALLRNPFIWSCLLGIAVNILGLTPSGALASSLNSVGQAAVGTGLLVIGASLNLKAIGRPKPALLVATAFKLLLMPLIGYGLARLFDLDPLATGCAIIALAVPTATSSYVLAKEMQGDAPFMAEIIIFQTVAAMITMPVFLTIFCR